MKFFLYFLFLIFPVLVIGQNRYFTIGFDDNGICFGNSVHTNGIRINAVDKNVKTINGFDFTLISKEKNTNGIKLSLHSEANITNGLNFSVWGLGDKITNGIGFGTGVGGNKINGIGIGLIGCAADTMNGLFFGGLFGANNMMSKPIKRINGFSVGFATNFCEELNGLTISMFNSNDKQHGGTLGLVNVTDELYGIQIGLWNVAKNKKRFKRMPLININFKRKSQR